MKDKKVKYQEWIIKFDGSIKYKKIEMPNNKESIKKQI